MTKKLTIFAITIFIVGITALVVFMDWQPAPEPFLCNGRPCNVILIIPEALSARHMGIYGYERDTTPFIDEFFSEESLVFENAWSNAPWTFPSFAALYTSQLAADVFVESWWDKLSETIPTFIDVLGQNEIPKLAAHSWTLAPFRMTDSFIRQFGSKERFLGADPLLFLKAAEWVEEQIWNDGGQPFFLLLQPYAPHSPYDSPEPYRYFFDAPSEYPGPVATEEISRVRRAFRQGKDVEAELERFRLQYDQEIRYLDSEFEAFIARMPEELLGNTVFVFTSDHGEAFGQHGQFEHHGIPHEEVIHIPFLIRAPGVEQKRIQEPITLLDAGPTILGIFGLKSPQTFQGISLASLLRGEELQLEDRIVRAEEIHHERPPREEWPELKPQVRTEPLSYPRAITVRKGSWKLLQLGAGSLKLYNLERDYYEENNLIPQWQDLLKEEQAEILPLFEALGESPPFVK